jgi:hypothetical protein
MTDISCMICRVVVRMSPVVFPTTLGWALIEHFGWVCPRHAEITQAVYAIGEFLKTLGG